MNIPIEINIKTVTCIVLAIVFLVWVWKTK